MPRGLKRYQETRDLHFITFSCYCRAQLLGTPQARRVFEQTLERVRRWYGLFVTGYVVMPEHVHLLIGEPERSTLAVAIQMLKQMVAQKLTPTDLPTSATHPDISGSHAITTSMSGLPRSARRSCATCIPIP